MLGDERRFIRSRIPVLDELGSLVPPRNSEVSRNSTEMEADERSLEHTSEEEQSYPATQLRGTV